MESERSDLLQGTLDMMILKIVGLGSIHGYAISKRIQQSSEDVLKIQQGSLYPALHRLEQKKLLKAEWRVTESGREAKFYELSINGRKRLVEAEKEWERLSTAIGLVMSSC